MLGQPPPGRPREKKEGNEERRKSLVEVFFSRLRWHTRRHPARWTRTRSLTRNMHSSSSWRCTEPHRWKKKKPTVTAGQSGRARDMEGERERERDMEKGISVILAVSLMTQTTAPHPFPLDPSLLSHYTYPLHFDSPRRFGLFASFGRGNQAFF